MSIVEGQVVQFHYTLFDEAGEVLDDSAEREAPMSAVVGAGQLLRGLDAALVGRSAGERFEVVVPPELGYGVRRGGPQPVPRSFFGAEAELTPQRALTVQMGDGRPMLLWVDRVEGDQVWVDPHHPLAGKTLRYVVEVLTARDATLEELGALAPGHGVGQG
jgi:FKBP-type peptidyl-prolyl cis-trans isomerase SlyD